MDWNQIEEEVENLVGERLNLIQSGYEDQRLRLVETIAKLQLLTDIIKNKSQQSKHSTNLSCLSPKSKFETPKRSPRVESNDRTTKIDLEKQKKEEVKSKLEEQRLKKNEEDEKKKKRAEEIKKKKEEENKIKEATLKKKNDDDAKKKEAADKKKEEDAKKKEEAQRKIEENKKHEEGKKNENRRGSKILSKIGAADAGKIKPPEDEDLGSKIKPEISDKPARSSALKPPSTSRAKKEETNKEISKFTLESSQEVSLESSPQKDSKLPEEPKSGNLSNHTKTQSNLSEEGLAKSKTMPIEESKIKTSDPLKKLEHRTSRIGKKSITSIDIKFVEEALKPDQLKASLPDPLEASLPDPPFAEPCSDINEVSKPPPDPISIDSESAELSQSPLNITPLQISLEETRFQIQHLEECYSNEELITEKKFELSVGAKSALSLLTTLDDEKFYLNSTPSTEVIWTFRVIFTFFNEDLPEDDTEAWEICKGFLIKARDKVNNKVSIDKYLIERFLGFNFSNENIDRVELLVEGKEMLLQPQYFTERCPISGLLMFAVREAVVFSDAIRGKSPVWMKYRRLIHKQKIIERKMIN